MPVSLLVDPLHLTAEELAVRGGVTQMVHGDVIMNHLVHDSRIGLFLKLRFWLNS